MKTDAYELERLRRQYILRGSRPLNRRREHPAPWICAGMVIGLIIHLILF